VVRAVLAILAVAVAAVQFSLVLQLRFHRAQHLPSKLVMVALLATGPFHLMHLLVIQQL
jgi:hypothetical protein